MIKNVKGFILIREYPHSKRKGSYEPFTTGEFLNYPDIWRPIYDNEKNLNFFYDIINKFEDFNEQNFNIALSIFKKENGRDAHIDDVNEMNIVSAIEKGIKYSRLFL